MVMEPSHGDTVKEQWMAMEPSHGDTASEQRMVTAIQRAFTGW
jgi:hypothetical protein